MNHLKFKSKIDYFLVIIILRKKTGHWCGGRWPRERAAIDLRSSLWLMLGRHYCLPATVLTRTVDWIGLDGPSRLLWRNFNDAWTGGEEQESSSSRVSPGRTHRRLCRARARSHSDSTSHGSDTHLVHVTCMHWHWQ
jgi:hypothetical protein